jgi:hypothetical protein
MNSDKKSVKISDIIESQIPEAIASDNPLFSEFLSQYYKSTEYQGAPIDIVENLTQYKNVDSFDAKNLIKSTKLTKAVLVSDDDDNIHVESTLGWPSEYGLLKIDDEIITYTGITTNTFTGCIRGFSGIESLSDDENPGYLKFSSSEYAEHLNGSEVFNLSNLFLIELFEKTKYQFTPGFEELDFDSKINNQNFISNARSFYQSKGSKEAFDILFKVLYGESPQILIPSERLFTPSDDKWIVVERFIVELVEGDINTIIGQTLYQDENESKTILPANGSIYRASKLPSGDNLYSIDIFSGYSNNLNPKGAIYGEFVPTSKTYCTQEIKTSSNSITVVSTIGFEQSGSLIINGIEIKYEDKTNTEFLNCTGITEDIKYGDIIYTNNYAYAYSNNSIDSIVKVRILNTLSDIDFSDEYLMLPGDNLKIRSLGNSNTNSFTKSLLYNVPSIIFVGEVVDGLSPKSYGVDRNNGQVRTKYPHYLKNNDLVEIYSVTENKKLAESLVSNVSEITFTISFANNLKLNHIIKLRRIPIKSSSTKYSSIDKKFNVNIQDSFEDLDYNYIAANGFPNLSLNPIIKESKFIISNSITDTLTANHKFLTGDQVTVEDYNVEFVNQPGFTNKLGITTGSTYFVKRIDNTNIKLAESRINLKNGIYIDFKEYVDEFSTTISGFVKEITLIDSKLYNNEFTTTKLFKKIPKNPKYAEKKVKTSSGAVGIFINGVEIQSYKSFDKLYNGTIESIDVLNGGNDYDLLNPPKFSVNYVYNNLHSFVPEIVGELKSLEVKDSGFDYLETPTISVLGGNSTETIVEVKMKRIRNEVEFNAADPQSVVTLDEVNKFVFEDNHKMKVGDAVIYYTYGNSPIGIGTEIADGFLIDNSVYYITNVGAGTSFEIASTYEDAVTGQNIINLRTRGNGLQKFISVDYVNVVDEANIVKSSPFRYKSIAFTSDNINPYDNIIEYENHGFLDGEEVIYSQSGGSAILDDQTYYYIVKIDDSKFRVSTEKDGSSLVSFLGSGSDTVHYISYSPIRIEIRGKVTEYGISNIGYSAQIEPIVRGSIVSVIPVVTANYSSNILNYENSPIINTLKGENAAIGPIITDGSISRVVIFNGGKNYYNSLEIKVTGIGYGAKLLPVVQDGILVDVKVISPGIGYDNFTTLTLVEIGSGASFKANLKKWTVNELSKYSTSELNAGILLGENYYPNTNNYGIYNLNSNFINLFDIKSTEHSPIIGWAYDGCPIYGQYGYKNIDGSGGIITMKSSYKKVKTAPSLIDSPNIDFIEDYQYVEGLGDLDEHNGRYCITPEYPDGVYAYFATNIFPFFIGDTYSFDVPSENFDADYSQKLNLNNLKVVKHTAPYYTEDYDNYYDFFEFKPSNQFADLIVTETSSGGISRLELIDSGSNYKIGDKIKFDNTKTDGFGALGEVVSISGVSVSSITTYSESIPSLTFISNGNLITAISSNEIAVENDNFVSITSISDPKYSELLGLQKAIIIDFRAELKEPLETEFQTGITTSISVTTSISNFKIGYNFKIENEVFTVIGLDYINNRVNVKREPGGIAYGSGAFIKNTKSEFSFEIKNNLDITTDNDIAYFYSSSVSIGTDSGVGVGNTIVINPLGPGKSISKYVRTAGIWIPNHNFKTGDKVTYTEANSTIIAAVNGIGSPTNLSEFSSLYIVDFGSDIIGLTTVKSNSFNQSDLLYFTNEGTGNYHKLSTDRQVVTGSAVYSETILSTEDPHGLSIGDLINVNVTVGSEVEYIVSYNSITKRLVIDSENNPELLAYKNQTIKFNLTSTTLSKTKFKLYTDRNYINEYYGSGSGFDEVYYEGDYLYLKITDTTPDILYYNIESTIKTVYEDISVKNNNTVLVIPSNYNIICGVVTYTENDFTVNLEALPESNSYISDGNTTISYNVIKSDISGPVYDARLILTGKNYKKLPPIVGIGSTGINCELIPVSDNIGKIESTKIISNSPFPADKTLKPYLDINSVLYLTDNYSVAEIEVNDPGSNYLSPPKVKLYNELTNTVNEQFSGYCNLKGTGVSEIIITSPGTGIKKYGNKIIFTDNNNGLRILEAYRNQISDNEYRVSLRVETPSVGFTTSNPPPFKIGDFIYVEGIQSLGSNGYNSSDYNYNLFEVYDVIENLSSENETLIRYNLPKDPEVPSIIDFGVVVNAKNLPIAKLKLKENLFYSGESIGNSNIIKNDLYSTNSFVLRVNNSNEIELNSNIFGTNSLSKGKVVKIHDFNSGANVDSSKEQILGNKENKGVLSETTQKIQNNDYYQRFSYSIKSSIENSKWDPPISQLTHISGFKKFGDMQIESDPNSPTLTTSQSPLINVSLSSYVDASTINNFDLVLEDVDDHDNLYSEILIFNSKKLTDYVISKENRVLSIDDIASEFDTDLKIEKILVDTLPTFNVGSMISKYLVFIESTTSLYTDYELPLLAEVYISRRGNNVNLSTYSYYEDVPLGVFNSLINPSNVNEVLLEFIPRNINNIHSARTISDLVPLSGITTTAYGNTKYIGIATNYSSQSVPTQKTILISSLSECKSGNIFVGISTTENIIQEFYEMSFVYRNNNFVTSIYSENVLVDLGEVGISTLNTGNVYLTYNGIPNIPAYLYVGVSMLVNTKTNPSEIILDYGKLNSSRIQFTATTNDPVGISTISKEYAASKHVLEINKTIGSTTKRTIVQINSVHYDIIPQIEKYLNNITYNFIGEFDDIDFKTFYDVNSGQYTLAFVPNDLATYDIKFYEKHILRSTNPLL